jgi:hypothetical protein
MSMPLALDTAIQLQKAGCEAHTLTTYSTHVTTASSDTSLALCWITLVWLSGSMLDHLSVASWSRAS